MRCKCCDCDNGQNRWWKDGWYCTPCIQAIKETIWETKIREAMKHERTD